jgi:hypothetical protein
MRTLVSFGLIVALAGCGGQSLFERRVGSSAPAPATLPPPADSAAPPPTDPSALGTGNPFGTAIVNPDEDGGPAASAPPVDGRLGTTVASLGDTSEEGFWLKTALVSAPTPGRVVNVASGRSVQVELRPLDGPAGGGSQISMNAMRLLDIPITSLAEVEVYGS